MNHFVAGILRIILLEASAVLVVLDRIVPAASARARRRLDFAWRCLAVVALFSWTNYGALRGADGLINRWEQYHFFFGSKYLREIGYFDLYKATLLADRQSVHILDGVRLTRDLSTFEEVTVDEALRDAGRVRAAFSDGRWQSFKREWTEFARGQTDWPHLIVDHGNTGSPAWAIAASTVARLAGMSLRGQNLMALVDLALMAILFAYLARAFGTPPACAAAIIFAMLPICFDFVEGSLLRWDWLFALGMCLVCWKQERPAAAGAFLGYATLAKLFPIWFGVAFALAASWRFGRTRTFDRRWLRFVTGGAAAATLLVLVSAAMFGGFGVWREYARRIEVTRVEKFYGNQYSFRTVFLQAATSRPRDLARDLLAPPVIKQALREVDIGDYKKSFLSWQLALTALIAFALRAGDELEALAVGPLLVYVWLVVNAYYWNMLALPALVWCLRSRLAPLLFLHALLMWRYLYEHLDRGYAEGFSVGLSLFWLVLAWALSSRKANRFISI